jgi:replicative DNA helicase
MISAPASEKAVLGSWLIEKEAISACVDIIGPEHFYDQFNASVCRIILDAYKAGKAVDVVSVNLGLQEAGLASNQSLTALAELCHSVTTAAHASHHAKTVLDRYLTRQVIAAAQRLTQQAEGETLSEAEVKALSELVMRKEAVYAPALISYKNSLHDLIDRIGQKSATAVYRTGIKALDTAWYGMSAGEVILLGGAPGAGKSKLALKILSNLVQRNVPCLLFGTELDAYQTALRHLSMLSGVETWKLRIARADAFEWAKASQTVRDVMSEMPLHISPIKAPNLSQIDQAIVASGAKVVVIDSVFFCTYPKGNSIRERMEDFCRGLQEITKRREVVSILVAHLGRQAYSEHAQNRAPVLSDFGESKGLEITADKAALLWTPQAKQTGSKRIVEVILAKDRANNDRRGGHLKSFDLECDENTPDMKEVEVALA